jgi:hypothetical protein
VPGATHLLGNADVPTPGVRGHRKTSTELDPHHADLQGEGTMANTRVPDIALINLGFLLALKEAVVRDPVQAYYQFRLHPSDAAVIGDLGFDALESLALGLDQSIVTLRYTGPDLRDQLKTCLL